MENGGHKKKQSFCLHPLNLFPLNFDNNTDIARTNLKKKQIQIKDLGYINTPKQT